MQNQQIDYEVTYQKIVSFYDFADKLISTIEDEKVKDNQQQLDFITPLVAEIQNSADFLAKEYRHFARHEKKPGMIRRKKIEQHLARIYLVIHTCNEISKKQKKYGEMS